MPSHGSSVVAVAVEGGPAVDALPSFAGCVGPWPGPLSGAL